MESNNSSSGVNTILIVVVLIVLVVFGVWYYDTHKENKPGVNIELSLPKGNSNQ